MPLLEMPLKSSSRFRIGLVGIFVLSLALRFWGLGRFNTLVFDEVYYVKFASNYLTQTPFFDGHPPLSKYLIAIGIWLGNQLSIGRDTVNNLAGAEFSTWSYRWLNALTGSWIPLVVAGIAYQLSRRTSYAFMAGLFAALDGLFLVESRYALNNVYLVIFGLLGLWSLLLALNSDRLWREAWLAAAGIFFGASASIKWNGLWFLLGAYGLWIAAWIIRWVQSRVDASPTITSLEPEMQRHPLQNLTRLKLWQVVLNLAVIPAAFYRLIWIPHLKLNPTTSFWELQQQILSYHERVGNGPKVHPYCADWYTWLLMIRPVAYFYKVTGKGAPLPDGTTIAPVHGQVIYDVHAIGNPILWWLSTLAMILVIYLLVQWAINWLTVRSDADSPTLAERWSSQRSTDLWLGLFLVVNYAANLLPWVRVTRCTFLYHYMGASVFASMAIAWLVDRWLTSSSSQFRTMGIAVVVVIAIGFIFWMPIYLGLPLSPLEFKLRMWLPSWI